MAVVSREVCGAGGRHETRGRRKKGGQWEFPRDTAVGNQGRRLSNTDVSCLFLYV